MRHGKMMRTLAAALLVLVVSSVASAADGCNNCAPAPKSDCGPCASKSLLSRFKSGPTCCDANFIFGSSRSFFSPCSSGCSALPLSSFGRDRQRCDMPKYGTGIGQTANNCAGVTTFMNR